MQSIPLRKILVAVDQAGQPATKALKRAVDLAHHCGASLELFTCVTTGGFAADLVGLAAQEWQRALASQCTAELERIAQRLRREELTVRVTAQIGVAAHESILRQARVVDADLIVIEARRHGRLARLLLSQTDFELVRRSPVPLLIVKSATRWQTPRVLAAIDPFHDHDKPLNLDARIVGAARSLAEPFAGSVHLAHVYRPLADFFPVAVIEPTVVAATPAQHRAYAGAIMRRFERAAARFGVPPRARHLRAGEPGVELGRLARSARASVVVMGAVSRSAMRCVFIGNTAERVLDSLRCDVLVVKPRGFLAPT